MAAAGTVVIWQSDGTAHELIAFLAAGTVVVWQSDGTTYELIVEGFAGGTSYDEDIVELPLGLTDVLEEELGDPTQESLYEFLEAADTIEDSMVVESLDIEEGLEAIEELFDDVTDGALFDEATVAELISTQMDMSESIYEQLIVFVVDLEYDTPIEAWVVNLKTNGISRYSWPNFNSFAFINGKYYAAKEDGIFELTGDSDDGEEISMFLTDGKREFESPQKKRVFAVYADAQTDGQVNLQVYADGQVYTYAFEVPSRNISGEMHETLRASPGRGLRARNWIFEIQNVAGSNLDISNIQIMPIVLDRRVR